MRAHARTHTSIHEHGRWRRTVVGFMAHPADPAKCIFIPRDAGTTIFDIPSHTHLPRNGRVCYEKGIIKSSLPGAVRLCTAAEIWCLCVCACVSHSSTYAMHRSAVREFLRVSGISSDRSAQPQQQHHPCARFISARMKSQTAAALLPPFSLVWTWHSGGETLNYVNWLLLYALLSVAGGRSVGRSRTLDGRNHGSPAMKQRKNRAL